MARLEIVFPEDLSLDYKTWVKYRQYAYNSSVWYIENYGGNGFKVRQRLLKKGFFDEDVSTITPLGEHVSINFLDDTVERLIQDLYIDEYKYARGIVRDEKSKNRGVQHVRRVLAYKGVPRDIIDEVLEDFDDSAELVKAYEKIIHSPEFKKITDPYKKKSKVYRALAFKGFNTEDISRVIEF